MIVDQLKNLSRYETLHPRFSAAFAFLQELLRENASDGKYSMPGTDIKDEIYVVLSTNTNAPKDAAVAEMHEKYIDVQVLLAGEEAMYIPASELPAVTAPYRADRDCELYAPAPLETCHRLRVVEGSFVIYFCGELHAPSVAVGTEATAVRKAVLKVLA